MQPSDKYERITAERIHELRGLGMTTQEIADDIGVKMKDIQIFCNAHGLKYTARQVRDARLANTAKTYITDKSKYRSKCWDGWKMTPAEVAELYAPHGGKDAYMRGSVVLRPSVPVAMSVPLRHDMTVIGNGTDMCSS